MRILYAFLVLVTQPREKPVGPSFPAARPVHVAPGPGKTDR